MIPHSSACPKDSTSDRCSADSHCTSQFLLRPSVSLAKNERVAEVRTQATKRFCREVVRDAVMFGIWSVIRHLQCLELLVPRRICHMRQRCALGVLLVALTVTNGCSSSAEKPAPPPPGVTVTQAIQRDVPIHQEWVGTMLQDRSAGTVQQISEALDKLSQAARKRPEIGSIVATFRPSVPQLFVDIDQDRVLKQGLQFSEVYQTLQAFLGGAYVNQFNRFGRQWKVYLQSEPEYRISADKINSFYVRTSKGEMTPLASLVTVKRVSGPEYTNRFNLFRSIQINGSPAPGYSSGQAMTAMDRCVINSCIVDDRLASTHPLQGIPSRRDQDSRSTKGGTRSLALHGTLTTTQGDSGGLAGITVQLAATPDDGNPLTTQTDDAGHYEFKEVKPGPYTISINQPGFAPFKKSLEVKAGESATVDARLELQTVSEQVEVSETTQQVATEDFHNS